MGDEKAMAISSSPSVQIDIDVGIIATKQEDEHKETEVFGEEGEGQVNFRTVGWVRAAMFLVKQTFATGVCYLSLLPCTTWVQWLAASR